MDNPAERVCGTCGERPAVGQIYFSLPLSEEEQAKYHVPKAELDMLLCELCGAKVFKHIKRMFTLQDLGLKRSPTRRAAHD